jgi:hypothetical protein
MSDGLSRKGQCHACQHTLQWSQAACKLLSVACNCLAAMALSTCSLLDLVACTSLCRCSCWCCCSGPHEQGCNCLNLPPANQWTSGDSAGLPTLSLCKLDIHVECINMETKTRNKISVNRWEGARVVDGSVSACVCVNLHTAKVCECMCLRESAYSHSAAVHVCWRAVGDLHAVSVLQRGSVSACCW